MKEKSQINNGDKRKRLIKEDGDKSATVEEMKEKSEVNNGIKRNESEEEDPYTKVLKRFRVSKSRGKENWKEENENIMFSEIESKLSTGILSTFEYNVHRRIKQFPLLVSGINE
jgi:hypothetical protein